MSSPNMENLDKIGPLENSFVKATLQSLPEFDIFNTFMWEG